MKLKIKVWFMLLLSFLVIVPWSIILKKTINGSNVSHVSLMPYMFNFLCHRIELLVSNMMHTYTHTQLFSYF